jgi:hypothetical protein
MTIEAATTTTLNELALERDNLREAKRELEQQVKALDELLAVNEFNILEAMDAQGVTRTGVGPYSMSVSEQTVGNVQDWDEVYNYIHRTHSWHLLQRRLANAAYKEILDSGQVLEGVEPFVKRSLNFRKSSSKSA